VEFSWQDGKSDSDEEAPFHTSRPITAQEAATYKPQMNGFEYRTSSDVDPMTSVMCRPAFAMR